MELMSPLDSVFLSIESREHPMHVGGLQLFEPPEGAGPDYVREAHDALVANRDFQPTFRSTLPGRSADCPTSRGPMTTRMTSTSTTTCGARHFRRPDASANCSS